MTKHELLRVVRDEVKHGLRGLQRGPRGRQLAKAHFELALQELELAQERQQGGLSDTALGLLRRIQRLRGKAFLQPPHWDHEPTKEEQRDEQEAQRVARVAHMRLRGAVAKLADALMSPFI